MMSTGLVLSMLILVMSQLALLIDRQYERCVYYQLVDTIAMTKELHEQTEFDIEQILERVTGDILGDKTEYRLVDVNRVMGILEVACYIDYYNFHFSKRVEHTKKILV